MSILVFVGAVDGCEKPKKHPKDIKITEKNGNIQHPFFAIHYI